MMKSPSSYSKRIWFWLRKAKPEGRKADGDLYYHCPLCDGRQKLEIKPARKVWFCHKCGIGGKYEGTVSESGRVEITPAINQLEDSYSYAPEGSIWETYLARVRKLPPHLIQALEPHRGPDPYRVYFPCYRLGENTPAYMVGRAIFDEVHPKYLYPRAGTFQIPRKSGALWGLHRLLARPVVEDLILCEGILDAVWWEFALALLGRSVSEEQAGIIQRISPKRIIIFLDGDAEKESYQAALKLAEWTGIPIQRYRTPLGEDPDSLARGGMRKLEPEKVEVVV